MGGLAVLVVLAALPPTGSSYHLQLDVLGEVEYRPFSGLGYFDDGSTGNGYGLSGSGYGELRIYPYGVVDDETAPALQPFLQRAFEIHLSLGGGAGELVEGNAAIVGPNTTRRIGTTTLDFGLDGYASRHIHVGTGMQLYYWVYKAPSQESFDTNEAVLRPYLYLGLRWEDFRIDAGWSVSPYRIEDTQPGPFRVTFWGGAFFDARLVFRRWIDGDLHVDVIPGGALMNAHVTLWLRRRLGISVGLDGGAGDYIEETYRSLRHAGGRMAVQYWFDSRWAMAFGYAAEWQSSNPSSDFKDGVAHWFTAEISARPLR